MFHNVITRCEVEIEPRSVCVCVSVCVYVCVEITIDSQSEINHDIPTNAIVAVPPTNVHGITLAFYLNGDETIIVDELSYEKSTFSVHEQGLLDSESKFRNKIIIVNDT